MTEADDRESSHPVGLQYIIMRTTITGSILVTMEILVLAAFVPSPVLGGRGLHQTLLPLLEPGPVIGCPSPDGLKVGGWSTANEESSDFQSAIQYVLGLLNLPHGESSFTVKYACTQVVSGTNFYMVMEFVDGGSVTATVHKPLPSDSTDSNAVYQIMSLNYSEADGKLISKTAGTPHDGSPDVMPGGCPGAPGLMGGWTPADPMSTTIQGSVDYVLQILNFPTSSDTYDIEIACTQVVAGTNVYLYVGSTNGTGYFSATVFNSLPNSNDLPYQINELFLVDDRVSSNNVIVGSNSSGDMCPASGGPIGGWSEAAATLNSVQSAIDYVLQTLSLSTDPSNYNVSIACTQIVAGVNFYLSVDVTDSSHFSAVVHQTLQDANAEPYEIMQLDFSSK